MEKERMGKKMAKRLAAGLLAAVLAAASPLAADSAAYAADPALAANSAAYAADPAAYAAYAADPAAYAADATGISATGQEDRGEKKALITGFAEIPESQKRVDSWGREPEEDLAARMPSELIARVEGEAGPVRVPVSWECDGDYEKTNYFYYAFVPKIGGGYSVAEGVDLPYIGVWIGQAGGLRLSSSTQNEKKVFDFVRNEIGFNTAATCGVIANIQCESSFNPTASVLDVNGKTSFGLCQWNGVRFTALREFCSERGYNYKKLMPQLKFLKYELESSERRAASMVQNVPNKKKGAYQAGYNWARYFERCASRYHQQRGELARDVYWKKYGSMASDDEASGDDGADDSGKKYTIEYHLDGGTNDEGNPEHYSAQSGEITLKDPVKKGHTFMGWYRNAAMTQKIEKIKAGSTGNLKLYAKWRPNSYTIRFFGNGATSGKMKDMEDCSYDEIYSLSANKFKKTGCKFEGWNTKKNGKGKAYDDGEEILNLSAKDGAVIKLYAQWEAKTYLIRYELGGGGEMPAGSPTEYGAADGAIPLGTPARKGYVFKGWYEDEGFTSQVSEIPEGSTGDVTVYAKWQAVKYRIAFDGNGATSGSIDDVAGCVYDKTYKLPANSFKRSGFHFSGWNTRADGHGNAYIDGERVKNLSAKNNKTVTLFAQWSAKSYSITYHANGGKMPEGSLTEYTSDTPTFLFDAPEREGYAFEGWYEEPGFVHKVKGIEKGSEKNYDLYAKWKKSAYSIHFDGNGATGGSMADVGGIESDEPFALPKCAFSRSGYKFLGWNTDAGGKGSFYADGATVLGLSKEDGAAVTLYAQWDAGQ